MSNVRVLSINPANEAEGHLAGVVDEASSLLMQETMASIVMVLGISPRGLNAFQTQAVASDKSVPMDLRVTWLVNALRAAADDFERRNTLADP